MRDLPSDEPAKQRDRHGTHAECVCRTPPVVLGLDDRVDAEHQGAGDERRAGYIRAAVEADALIASDQPQGQHRRHDADREVDEEDPVPIDRLRDHTPEQQADRRAGRGHEAEHADRLGPLPGLGEHRHDHSQDHGRGQRAADALDEPRDDQHGLALGGAAQRRGGDEHREAGQEDVAASDQIPEPAGKEEQAAEGDQVGVDHPREIRLRESEIALDRRQRDVHDRHVEDDHQRPDAQHDKRDPA